MPKFGLGEIVALVGLVVFLLSGVGSRRQRRGQQSQAQPPAGQRWQQAGTIVAVGLIIAGLVLMAMRGEQ